MGKLLANLATVPVYLVMEAILPRALGPSVYGNFNFAISVFTQFTTFLDMGTSTCFYNALSRRQDEHGLVAFYLRVTGLVLLVTLAAGCLLLVPRLGSMILPDVPGWYAPLAALYGFLMWASRVARSMNDALGLTVAGEAVRSVMNLTGAVLLLMLFWLGFIHAGTLFALHYFMLGGMVLGCLAIMRRCWPGAHLSLPPGALRAYRLEFTAYSAPLFVQALLTAAGLAAERWLLQWFEGSVQQGYFALSQRVSMACFMFVSAMTPLLMRELAIAWGRDDRAHMGRLVARFAPMLFAVAAWFSSFTFMEASALVRFFGGAQFAAALLPVQIMALYPAHQVYGQLASSVFHATGKTVTLRNMALAETLAGFALVWFLLAPPELYGLQLGATGLALKTVILQFVSVNVLLWLAARLIPLGFWRNLALQGLILGSFLMLAWLCRLTSSQIIDPDSFGGLIFTGCAYTFLSALLVIACPLLAGSSRAEFADLHARFMRRKRRK